MGMFMRNVFNDRVYVYDEEVFKRRKGKLDIVHGAFDKRGNFVPDPASQSRQMGLSPDVSADELRAKISQLQTELAIAKGEDIEEVPAIDMRTEEAPLAAEEAAPIIDPSSMIDKINKLRTKAEVESFALKKLETVLDMEKTKAVLKDELIALVNEKAKKGTL